MVEIPLSRGEGWLVDLRARIDRARYWSGPVLLLGGDRASRERVARVIHDLGPSRGGVFRAVDCRGPGRDWLSPPHGEFQSRNSAGTLYLERLECLPEVCQRQLLASLDGAGPLNGYRIMAGLGLPVQFESAMEALLPDLVDSLDKWRIHLSPI